MRFFFEQELARRRTRLLYFLFVIALAGSTLVWHTAVITCLWLVQSVIRAQRDGGRLLDTPWEWWQPEWYAFTTIIGTLIILLTSLGFVLRLRQGGISLASMVGGREVTELTKEAGCQKLFNVVHEMAIAAQYPQPRVFIIPSVFVMNAFVAGNKPEDQVVVATEGLVNGLKRDELQGVIAHEFSHLMNGDAGFNLRVMGLVKGFYWMSWLNQQLFKSQGGTVPIFMVPLLILTNVAGRLIDFWAEGLQAAISRQREILADATAVQLTRYPPGLANALKRIGYTRNEKNRGVWRIYGMEHLCFVSATTRATTHPPLAKRIRALEPDWDGRWLEPLPQSDGQSPEVDAAKTLEAAREATGVVTLPRPLPEAVLESLYLANPFNRHYLNGRLAKPLKEAASPGMPTKQATSAGCLFHSVLLICLIGAGFFPYVTPFFDVPRIRKDPVEAPGTITSRDGDKIVYSFVDAAGRNWSKEQRYWGDIGQLLRREGREIVFVPVKILYLRTDPRVSIIDSDMRKAYETGRANIIFMSFMIAPIIIILIGVAFTDIAEAKNKKILLRMREVHLTVLDAVEAVALPDWVTDGDRADLPRGTRFLRLRARLPLPGGEPAEISSAVTVMPGQLEPTVGQLIAVLRFPDEKGDQPNKGYFML